MDSYVKADKERRLYVRSLEAELSDVKQELVNSKRENVRLKEAVSTNAQVPATQATNGDTSGRSSKKDPEVLHRELRNSRRFVYDLLGDRVRQYAHS